MRVKVYFLNYYGTQVPIEEATRLTIEIDPEQLKLVARVMGEAIGKELAKKTEES